jgi:hypothetical protein
VNLDITYWEHRRMTAVANERDAEAALLGYLEDADEYSDREKLTRARAALADIRVGVDPADLDIVAEALRDNNFDAPEGTEPVCWDTPTDYTATIRPAGDPPPPPRPGLAALGKALDKVDEMAAPLQDADDVEAHQKALAELACVVGAFLGRPLDLLGFTEGER